MSRLHRIVLLTGALLGLALGVGSEAQAQSQPAYLVVEIRVTDPEGFAEYAEKATQTVLQYGGSFLTFGENIQTIEGPDPNGTYVIIRFDSADDASRWLNSPEYNAVKGIRHRTAETRQYLVEGPPAQ